MFYLRIVRMVRQVTFRHQRIGDFAGDPDLLSVPIRGHLEARK